MRNLFSVILTQIWLLLAIGAATQAHADVLSPGARLLSTSSNPKGASMQRSPAHLPNNPLPERTEEKEEDAYIPLIVKLTDPSAPIPEGVVELHRRGDLMLAYVKESMLEVLGQSGYFSRMEGREAAIPTLDKAREFTGYDRVMAGEDLPMVYTGRGVTVGLVDAGFDPNHVEFLDPETGQSRVCKLVNFSLNPAENISITSPAEIAAWTTDDPSMYHATHVAGILGGGYKGNEYYGIAPGCELVASTSPLYDALLLSGMEEIIARAKEQGQPAVINMSVSCGTGPHDGTSLFSQYLRALSQEAVICISAGNDGMRYGYFYHTFANSEPTGLKLVDLDLASWYAAGVVDVWSMDATPLNFKLIIYDRETGQVVYRVPVPEITAEHPEIYVEFPNELNEYMEGSVVVASEINPLNGRFNAQFLFDLYNYPLEDESGHSIRYVAGVEISGADGQHMRAYSSDLLRMKVCPGYQGTVTTNGCLNDFVTGEGVIGVGALTTRTTWPLANGDTGSSRYVVGKIADFSGYWREGDICLPDIVAPGAHLISAMSNHYAEQNAERLTPACVENIDGVDYYWKATSGTSMASPYMAGICALMLEANPDLTPAEVKNIVISTASTPSIEPLSPRWGKGVLDSHAAILEACRRASLPVVKEATKIDPEQPIELYNLSGMHLATLPDLGALRSYCSQQQGIYILRQGGTAQKFVSR